MKSRLGPKIVALSMGGLLWGILAGSAALAGLDVSLDAAVRIGDDTDVYIAVSSRYYDQDPQHVRDWNRQCQNPDDLAVALFLSRHTSKSPAYVLTLHAQGASWWDIGVGLGVKPEVWFVPVKRDPDPPFGKAYGHWKNHKKNREPLALTDGDCRNLVAARVLAEYYNVTVELAMEWRASGQNLAQLTSREYRKRHGNGPPSGGKVAANDQGGEKPGQGKGKGRK